MVRLDVSKYLPLDYYDLHLNPNASIVINTNKERSVMVFTLLGNAYIGGELVKEKTAAKLTSSDQVEIRSTDKNAQVLYVSSTSLGEPVVWGGPIVMNTKEELKKAFDDLDQGTFYKREFHIDNRTEEAEFMNSKVYEFEAEIKKVPDIDGAYVN